MKGPLSAVIALVLMLGAPLAAQSPQQQNAEILNELKAIRQLLEKLTGQLNGALQPPPAAARPAAAAAGDTVKLAEINGYIIGKPDAPLTMVEFTDLQCAFCRRFHITTFEQLKKEYIDTGKLRYVSRDFPLAALHPLAMSAAQAARCAGEQGKFWEMRHTILVNNTALTSDAFAAFAQDLKLNADRFKSCTSDGVRYQAEIQKEIAEGASVGITGTPSFIIGRTLPTGLDGVRIVGAQPYAAFDAQLKKLFSPSP